MYKSVSEVLEEKANKHPHNIAIVDGDISLSYFELNSLANIIGNNLNKEIKDTNKAPVVVFMEKCLECLVSFYGVIKSGNFYVCIDINMAPERIKKIFSLLNPQAIIVKDKKVLPFAPAGKVLEYDDLIIENNSDGKIKRCTSIIDSDPLYVLYTSGSTGIPKGSVICHRSVLAYANWAVTTFHFDEKTNFGSQTPFYFSMSVFDIYASLLCGGTITIIPKKFFSFPIKLLEFIKDKAINTIYWVPSALGIVANINAFEYVELPRIDRILFAGEVMPTRLLNTWRKHFPKALFANLFGPTEITDIALYYIVNRTFKDDEPIPIGHVCDNMAAFALNKNGEMIGKDEVGELYFRGTFLGCGYYNMPEKTAEVFVQNPLNNCYPDIVYKTGDLVKINEYDEYMYVGRIDFQIKHMGYRIELGEIENVVSSHVKIETCACLFDSVKDEIILVYQGKVSEKDLYSFIKKCLPDYMRPSQMINIRVMPHNANGKIDRQQLKKEYIN